MSEDTQKEINNDPQNLVPPLSHNQEPADQCASHISQIEEYKAGWQRAQADYKNLQSEIEKNKSELVRWSERHILEEFIPVYDNFKKAFRSRDQHAHEEAKDKSTACANWVEGIRFIMKQFGDILKQHEVEEIPTLGQIFDPRFHEAVGEAISEEQEDGMITQEIEGGYCMKGKVLRVAKVVVSKKT
ncbi:MAG: nucleotide exchange factor GrpE [Candidatus Magasanikbacteria bacterium]|nr:nucleotide exchange factor GrpE [Candidatus Magasanikbacteria bacterium]